MTITKVKTGYYKQYDADFERPVPGEGYGGWYKEELELDLSRTAVVVLHAWDFGTREQFPGWHRAVEYIPRAEAICRKELPLLLDACRRNGMTVFHVVEPIGDYYKTYPGYRRAVRLAGETSPEWEQISENETYNRLQAFRRANAFPGSHNFSDIDAGFARLDIPEPVRPVGEEGVAATSEQLFALCREHGIHHLVYTGFALNACILLNPGGMADMRRHGLICSVIPEATTAVENKETAGREDAKALTLWQVALFFGFVFGLDDWLAALSGQDRGAAGQIDD
ncbi:isochorismatase family protein [Cohnella hashimotonis]|uniref:Isochorismatase family protein n=1 Tax=Cohnella hashimotonis TaxID=2826895 RepID=A0ABT6TCA7_9BACL|nr:isochorismatase family protein [Cohnella hashimotonis]MDI4643452.1 isochorismatase family protein [Cohnella hashimotonis]